MNLRVLIADDEPKYRMIIKDTLENEGYEVITASNGEEVVDKFYEEKNIDLVILDIMMPKLDGREACREIRRDSNVLILMLTALGDEKNEIIGLNTGADSYMAKPFSLPKLIARVNALTRKIKEQKSKVLEFDDIKIDENKREIYKNNNLIELTPKEYDLFMYFILNKGIVQDRNKLLNSVWGFDFYGTPRTVDTHVKSLRSKLDSVGDRIKTVWGKGYIFE